MEDTSHIKIVKNKSTSVRNFAIAIFVVVPAVVFWAVASILGVGIASLTVGEEAKCNVARVPVKGIITTTDNGLAQLLGMGAVVSADGVVENIKRAEENENIKAIVVDIDSPGGTPVAGDEIMSALRGTNKPVVAVIRDRGTSAAYWAAVGADYIIASPVSDVGSIGVTMSYLETASSTEYEGSRWINISSGAFKDAGHPERVLRKEEQKYFQSQVDDVFEYMLDRISGARSSITKEELRKLADGRAYLGSESVSLKLIDKVGGFDEAKEYIMNRLNIHNEDELSICSPAGGRFGGLLQ